MKRTRRIVQILAVTAVLLGVFVFNANCERWCPFGGVEALYTYLTAGDMLCSLGVSNFFILGGVLVSTVLLRRAFCGYLCPIGAISEWLGRLGKLLRLKQFRISGKVDRLLSLLKYGVLVIILYATWRAGELVFRGFDPCYALISRHGPDITWWAYVISVVVAVGSLIVILPFCRWLCPMAAVFNPFSRFALARIQRDLASCVDCGVCAKHCPVGIPVDQVVQVTAARCFSCLNCLEACPTSGSRGRSLAWGPPGTGGRTWSQAFLIGILLLCITSALAVSYLIPIPSFVRIQGVRPSQTLSVNLRIEDLTCRGRANLFYYFLQRDDVYAIPGFLKVEAWPGPGLADVRITFDSDRATERSIKRAITEPYFDTATSSWRTSPFRVEGYDPLNLDIISHVLRISP